MSKGGRKGRGGWREREKGRGESAGEQLGRRWGRREVSKRGIHHAQFVGGGCNYVIGLGGVKEEAEAGAAVKLPPDVASSHARNLISLSLGRGTKRGRGRGGALGDETQGDNRGEQALYQPQRLLGCEAVGGERLGWRKGGQVARVVVETRTCP